ncbi:zinc-dependent metalloprotease family protein [Lacinutrix sp. Hel_I_90]|uniref:reprolysin-like metallopeptidase n=1 Tax=Lacinutrix sp. Hel_I_90 TaxID=1249999 RepID=UPI000B128FF2|nr:zinc-dependent metalloprotease family protein [Lacinutrix sp. Hel_I_90]
MKQFYSKFVLILVTILMFSAFSFAQNGKSLWSKTTQNEVSKKAQVFRKTQPNKANYYQLDINSLKGLLQNAPDRKTTQNSNLIISFPTADNTFESFRVSEASVMAPELQAKYPGLRSYAGQSIENPSTLVRFSITSQGLHAMFLSAEKGTQFIDPFTKSDNNYIVYAKRDLPALEQSWECLVVDSDYNIDEKTQGNSYLLRDTGDGMMRDFRTAIATTIEYSAFHWGAAGLTAGDTEAAKRTAVMAAIVVTMTRNNFVYERDFSITMTLVANNDLIVFINSDSFSNNNANALINESQTVIDGAIGSANYDVGHTFSTGGGGLAQLNSPCTGSKARGITGGPSPVGDSYDIDFVAHELGHQFGAPHTFNGNQGNCAGGNREGTNAYEVGSGTTIMAYAGICGSDNVQGNSDAYFHQKSLQMIWDNVTTGNSTCATQTSTGNGAPTAEAGANYVMPVSTPYKLTGSSTDPDGTSLHTYTWEQYDLGPAGLPAETNPSGPMVRSFEGTENPTRYIPRLQDLAISGGSTTWEKLASVARSQDFRLTVRDNDTNGGRTAVDNMSTVTVAAAGPFLVTSQNTAGISWTTGSTETITWDVAGTTTNGVDTASVNILLSSDGGLTYDTTLATNVPNDGSQDITVPGGVYSGYCRVMVEAVGNIFFNINTVDFAVNATVVTTCNVYTTGPISTPIPDSAGTNQQGAPVFIPVTVTESTPITDIRVRADASHGNIGDLVMQLQAPNGLGFSNLWSRTCNSGLFQDLDVTFKDGSPAIACASPTTGTYSPANPMTGFNNGNPSGTWNLVFVDFNNGNTGMVNEWSIELCTTTVTLGVEAFNIENSLSIYPNPNNGEFTVKFNGATNKVQVQVFDIRGRSVLNNAFENTSGVFNETINLGNVQSGMYLLNVNDGSRTITKKIIVE